MRRLVVFVLAVLALVLVDQAVKETLLRLLPMGGGRSIVVIDGFFNLLCVGNEGCAWSLLQGHGKALAVFGLVMLAVLIWKRRTVFFGDLAGKRLATARVAEKLLYAGILGNVIDRLFRGVVVDMFDFQFGSYHYPCFNVADVYICTAAGLLVILSFLPKAKADA